MAQQAPQVCVYPLIHPITYFEFCRELIDTRSSTPTLAEHDIKVVPRLLSMAIISQSTFYKVTTECVIAMTTFR